MKKIKSLDSLIIGSLQEMKKYVIEKKWYGREREAVSLYAFGFLVPRCKEGGLINCPTQIGLDVSVRQLPGKTRKELVCKDLVLWGKPYENCWNKKREPKNTPVAIMEWKVGDDKDTQSDKSWLRKYSERYKRVSGYSVFLNPDDDNTTLYVFRSRKGVLKEVRI